MDTIIPAPQGFSGHTADYVVQAIRQGILDGSLPAHQPLRQDRIADTLGVSKVPVREALIQLKAEGLVTFTPNRGAVVSELSAAEAVEIYTMRIALELAALRIALPRLDRARLIRAESVLSILEQEETRAQWGRLNWEFHQTLYQASGMPRMVETIRALHDNVGRYLLIYLADPQYRRASNEEHRRILQACRDRDSTAALEQLRVHLEAASRELAAFLEKPRAERTMGGSDHVG
jgi:DNA-binding GntR family transcriptional regulator